MRLQQYERQAMFCAQCVRSDEVATRVFLNLSCIEVQL